VSSSSFASSDPFCDTQDSGSNNVRPSDPAEFDAYHQNYNAAVNASISFSGLTVDFFTRVKAEYIFSVLATQFDDVSRLDLLDVGCGIGNCHSFFARKIRTLAGVDVSSDCIVTAAKRNPWVDYRSYDGNRLPFDDSQFDVAFTICVMHHVAPEQWASFVRELRRVVKPGGVVLVFEHNPYNLLTRHVVSNCVFDSDAVLLTAGQTQRLLKEAGFHGVEARYILTVPPANRILQKVDSLFGRLPLGAQYYAMGIS
jgi:2-polyprenyl-3-methyl-5-hydroxy-6-metoxy-1,4-benzoquinol methylase